MTERRKPWGAGHVRRLQGAERERVGRELVAAWRKRGGAWAGYADTLELELLEESFELDPCDCGAVRGPNGGYIDHSPGSPGCELEPDTAPSWLDGGRGALRRLLARLPLAGGTWRTW